MRIGIYTEIYKPVLNGVVVSVESFREQLQARGHEVFVFTPAYMRYTDPHVLTFHSLPLPTRMPYRLATPFLMDGKVPDLDVIHAQTPFMTGLMAWNHARRAGVPLVFTYHTRLVDYHHYLPFSPALSRSFLVWVSRTFGNLADRVIVPTPPIQALLEAYGVKTPIDVVPTGVRIQPSAADACTAVRDRLGIPSHHRVLLYVGRLAHEKNLGMLVEAFIQAGVPDTHLLLVGDGPLRESLEALVTHRGMEGFVHLPGPVPHRDIADWYGAADLFVFPSLTETQGLVVEEALQVGLPTVAVGAGGVIDAVGRWQGGRLVMPHDDAEALTRRFADVLAETLEETALVKLKRSARANIARDGAERAASRLLDVYQTAIDLHPRNGRSKSEKYQLSRK